MILFLYNNMEVMKNMDLNNYLKNLETIVNIDSGSHNKKGIEEVISFLKELYSGWHTKVYDSDNPVLVIKNREAEDIDYLFIGHIDTVFPEGEAKRRPFKIENNIAKGPGVLDMKSGDLLIYENVKDLKDSNKNICVIHNSDEEIGSTYSKDIILEHGKKAKYIFVFEPARANGNMVSKRKGILRKTIEFIGKNAHAGVNPQDGIDANIEACNWALELYKFHNIEEKNSLNVGIIKGGDGVNVVSSKCTIDIEARSFDINFFNKIEEKIEYLSKNTFVKGIEVKIYSDKTVLPLTTNENTKKLMELYDSVKSELNVNASWEETGGISDANTFGGLNIATVDGLGCIGNFMHSPDEFIEIDSIVERYNVTKKVLEKLMQE